VYVCSHYVSSIHVCVCCVLVSLQYDEDAERRKVVATKKRKLDAMEEQWRVCRVHYQDINI